MELEKKYTIIIDDAVVSTTGRLRINEYLVSQQFPSLWGDWWSWKWVETNGQFRGKLPKRVSSYVRRWGGKRLTTEQLSIIGNIAKENLLSEVSYTFDFTDKFNWEAGDFGDSCSCFWGCRNMAKGVMEKEGVLAIRFYAGYSGIGRAWLYKLSDTQWILFNAYGLSTIDCANIFARFLGGWEYDEVVLTVNGEEEGLIYINARSQVIYKDNKITDINLDWSQYIWCDGCDNWFLEEDGCDCW